MKIKVILILFGVTVLAIQSNSAFAIQITPSDFSSQAIVETFDTVGPERSISSPLIVNGNTYSTSSGTIRILDYFIGDPPSSERCYDGSGTCIGTGLEDLETISVEFGTAVEQAGLWVGLTSDPFSATVSFFDTSDALLGAIDLSGIGGMLFAGWQSDSGLISRITVEDSLANSRVTMIDQVMFGSPMSTNPVPEPATILLFGTGIIGLASIKIRRKN